MLGLKRSLVAVVACLLAGAPGARADILIASIGPMTGAYASMGEQMRRGAEMAVADLVPGAGEVHHGLLDEQARGQHVKVLADRVEVALDRRLAALAQRDELALGEQLELRRELGVGRDARRQPGEQRYDDDNERKLGRNSEICERHGSPRYGGALASRIQQEP